MTGYRLTAAAEDDVEAIFFAGLMQFGLPQADKYQAGLFATFEFLSRNPKAARLRREIEPPVRAFRYRSHMIVYDLEPGNRVTIIRVRHGREDWLPLRPDA